MLSGAERVNLVAGVVKVRMIVAASVEVAGFLSGREKPFDLTAAPILGANTGLLLHGAGLAAATTASVAPCERLCWFRETFEVEAHLERPRSSTSHLLNVSPSQHVV
jgi:hypothetical protein